MLRRILTTSLFFVLALGTAWAADVTLQTDDGVKLHAVYNPVKSATRGAVLVHMAGRSAEDWAFIATKLNQSGVATLAVDLRGHGGNVSPTSSPPRIFRAIFPSGDSSMNMNISAVGRTPGRAKPTFMTKPTRAPSVTARSHERRVLSRITDNQAQQRQGCR